MHFEYLNLKEIPSAEEPLLLFLVFLRYVVSCSKLGLNCLDSLGLKAYGVDLLGAANNAKVQAR